MKTRLFQLAWNNAKIPNLSHEARFGQRNAEGVQFSTGCIALSNGVVFESMNEMERILKPYGRYEVTFAPEKIEGGDHAQTA